MARDEFMIDPRNKLGADAGWEENDDFAAFVNALNNGVVVRPDGLARTSDLPRENELDAASLSELKSKLAGYR